MENLNKRPSKGILRFSEGSSRSNSVEKDIKWDEANIKETLHPEDKDYGYMKIDEPPTPYSCSPHGTSGENSDEEDLEAKTNDLLERASKKIKEPPVTIEGVEALLDETELNAIENQVDQIAGDEEEPSGAKVGLPSASTSKSSSFDVSCSSGSGVSDFEMKRKRHYNEFHAVKLAKRLMQKELDNDGDDEEAKEEGNEQNETGEVSNEQGRDQRGEDVCFNETT